MLNECIVEHISLNLDAWQKPVQFHEGFAQLPQQFFAVLKELHARQTQFEDISLIF
jgi:hypothetical protein